VGEPQHFVIVCGYGCNLDSPLRPYLDRVRAYCIERAPVTVIACGGMTQQKSFPGQCEARVISQDLVSDEHENQITSDLGIRVYEERSSYTTQENIRNAAARIKRMAPEEKDRRITVFCEATRALKVAALVRHELGFPPGGGLPPIRIETDSWEQMHPVKELIGTLKDFACIYVPGFGDLHAWHRRRVAKTR